MAENEDAPAYPPPEPEAEDGINDIMSAMPSRMPNNGLRPQKGAFTPNVTDVMAAAGLKSIYAQIQQSSQPGGMARSGGPNTGPDMSQPSSISYNVHGAPMGGPGGNDRGGWTNVALDANRQPIGSPQSRAQQGTPQTTLAGQPAPNQNAQAAGQSPATSQPQASPLSSQEARNGDPTALQKPQMPYMPTAADFDREAWHQHPHATPVEHSIAVAKMVKADKPIADEIHRHVEEQLQVWDRTTKLSTAIAKGDYAAAKDHAAEFARTTKQASIDYSRSSKANEKLTNQLAALGDFTPENAAGKADEIKKGKPGNAIGWGKANPDEAKAAQIMRILDEFNTNKSIMDKAKKTMLGNEAAVNAAVAAAKHHRPGQSQATAQPGQPAQAAQQQQAPTDDPASTIPRPAAPAQPQQQAAQGQQQQQPQLVPGQTVMDGHVYVGGDPAKKKAWAKLDLDALGVGP